MKTGDRVVQIPPVDTRTTAGRFSFGTQSRGAARRRSTTTTTSITSKTSSIYQAVSCPATIARPSGSASRSGCLFTALYADGGSVTKELNDHAPQQEVRPGGLRQDCQDRRAADCGARCSRSSRSTDCVVAAAERVPGGDADSDRAAERAGRVRAFDCDDQDGGSAGCPAPARCRAARSSSG